MENYEKKYKEALEKARQLCVYPTTKPFISDLQDLFHELKESDDEKVRKHLISLFEKFVTLGVANECETSEIKVDDILAWLEKQGERPINKVEPKFKDGDWIVYKDTVWKVCNISLLNYYELLKINNEVSTRFIKDVDETAHLWTIQDAKNGDILVNGTILIMVDHLGTFENRPIIYSWYFADSEKFHGIGPTEPDRWEVKGFIPATKKQRELLFQKMKEAGYEWDAEKKELKITNWSKHIKYEPNSPSITKEKSAWSEEDSPYYDDICEILINLIHSKTADVNKDVVQKDLDWFVSLKDRVQPQPKQEWSEEDRKTIETAIEVCQSNGFSETAIYLKSLRDIVSLQPKQEWSERDKMMLDDIIETASHHCYLNITNVDWLKSLKERVQPKQEWSEEDEPQKELAETYLAVFDKKFPILPTLKGKQLADYKNFLNKCQQILGLKYWGLRPLQTKLFEKLSLLWAAWGAEHLKGLGQTDGDTDNEKQEWSEEDKTMMESLTALCDDKIKTTEFADVKEHAEKCKHWLKSL